MAILLGADRVLPPSRPPLSSVSPVRLLPSMTPGSGRHGQKSEHVRRRRRTRQTHVTFAINIDPTFLNTSVTRPLADSLRQWLQKTGMSGDSSMTIPSCHGVTAPSTCLVARSLWRGALVTHTRPLDRNPARRKAGVRIVSIATIVACPSRLRTLSLSRLRSRANGFERSHIFLFWTLECMSGARRFQCTVRAGFGLCFMF